MQGRSCMQMAHGVSQGTAVILSPASPAASTQYSFVIPASVTIPVARPITSTNTTLNLDNAPRDTVLTEEETRQRSYTESIGLPPFGASPRRPPFYWRRTPETMEDNVPRFRHRVTALGRGFTTESPLANILSVVATESSARHIPPISTRSISDSGPTSAESAPAAMARASMETSPEESTVPPRSSADSSRQNGADGEESHMRASERRGNQRIIFPQDLSAPPPARHAALVATRRISEAIATGGMPQHASSGPAGGSAGCGRTARRKQPGRPSSSVGAATRAASSRGASSSNTAVAAAAPAASTPPRRKTGPTKSRAEKTDSGTDRKPASAGRKRAAPSPKCGTASKKSETSSSSSSPENNKSDQSCCICLDVPDLTELSSINGCAHLFCFGCIEKWADRENTCPLCKNRFTKIDRVHKQPLKRKRKGEGNPGPRPKNTKKVKNRDQRADLNQGNPLQGLFASIDGNGVPQSIAQLIFSGLSVGGVSGSLMLATSSASNSGNPTPPNRPAQRSQGPPRYASSSLSSSRAVASASSGTTDSFPVHPVPVPMGLVRRLAAGGRGNGGGSVDATSAGRSISFGSIARSDSPWGTSEGGHNGPTASLQVRLGPSSRFGGPQFSAAATAAAFVDEHHSVDVNDSDDDFGTYPSYVRRVRNIDRERERPAVLQRYHYSTTRAPTEVSAPSPPSAPPPAPALATAGARASVFSLPGGETADTALLIDDSDDDDDIVEVVSSWGSPN
mmetsp:Transcript_8616/g.12521  ORF Transcript_8616/g.12521 Transcript_8616/m.12521 type:complete len:739 (-) Transcript_8616:1056-3272(-)